MNPYFPQLARGVEDEMQENDYRLIFGNSDESKKKEMEYIQTFVQNNVVGVITSTNNPDADLYTGLKIPVVFLDRTSSDRPSVYADGRQGGRIAAQEIIRRGSKAVTVIQGPADVRPAQERFEGAVEVLEEQAAVYQVLKTTSFSLIEAEKFAQQVFIEYPDTDGVIASNDIMASAVVKEAFRLGKRVPEDVQIIGFDDILLSRSLAPPLSTIHQPAYEMGREAARLLIGLIEGRHREKQDRILGRIYRAADNEKGGIIMAKIVVIGSASMDLVVTSTRAPARERRCLATALRRYPEGRGQSGRRGARLGAEVNMIGCVGEDSFGEMILSNLKSNGVMTDYVEPVTGMESGTAHIILAEGDNSIVVVKGANDRITPEYVDQARRLSRSRISS